MERFTFIKTNEKNGEDLDTEDERVEMEVVIDFEDMDKLSEKFQNFLSGCGYNKVVEIKDHEDDDDDDDDDDEWDDEDLEDELDDVEEDKS